MEDDDFEEYQIKRPKNISISSEKSLAQFVADSPRIYHSMLQDLFTSNLSVNTKLSDVFKKATPIILIFGLVMMVALVMGNAPTIIDTIAKYTGTERTIITETRIVYLSEEEARAQGMDVPPNPDDGVPVIICDDGMELIDGVCTLIPVEEPVVATESQEEGFDIVGNLVPKINTGGFLPPARTGDQDVLRDQAIQANQTEAIGGNQTDTQP